MSLADAAAQLNLPVFPCNAKKRPVNPHGFYGAETDPETILREFQQPNATHIGMATGSKSGLVVIDVDTKGPERNGKTWLDVNQDALPETRTHYTQSGGLHLIFKAPEGVTIGNSVDKIAIGVDVRGEGGYVIWPPSPGYRAADACTEPADMPEWLINACLKPKYVPPSQQPGPRATVNGDNSRYAEAALNGEYRAVATAPEGERNNQLNISAVKLGSLVGKGLLPYNTVQQELTHAALTAGLDRREIEATLKSGLGYGTQHPREIPERTPQHQGNGVNHHPIYHTHAEGPPKPEPFYATPFDRALLDMPAREWIYGHFLIKEFISVLGAPGGTGKSAYAFAVALSVATGRSLVGEAVHAQGNVWIYDLEDPQVELYRRLRAVMQHYHIKPEELDGKLFLDSGRDRPLVIARTDGDTLIAEPVVEEIVEELQRRKILLLDVDPFVRCHQVAENRNEQIDFVANLWSQVAAKARCSIKLVHHFRKGGMSGEADAFRGASALIDASRAALSIARMTEDEAAKLNIEPKDRRSYIRVDNAKLNLAPEPEDTKWLRLCNVPLPNGDNVQTVENWTPHLRGATCRGRS
jgi:hypothetical protein